MKKFTFLSAILLCTVWMAIGQWTYTNLSSPKKLMGVATLGTKAYFAGGHNGSTALALVESYDVETGIWANIGNLSVARQAPSGVTCGSKLFFGGGVSANFNTVYSTVDVYDTVSGTWTVAQLSTARFDIAALSYGNKVFFAGGCNYNIVCTDVVDIYDVLTGTWTISNLSIARAGMAYAVVGDLAVFAGGFVDGGGISDQVDIYNFTTNTWTTATLSEARVWASAVIVGDKVIIAGGMKYFPNVPSNRVDIFDASTGTWSTASLFEPRSWLSAGAVNGNAYFAGGSNVANGGVPYDFSNIVDIYNEADNSWSVDVLATPRQSQGLAVGDYFLVAGGSCDAGMLSSVEILYAPYVPHIIHVPGDYPTIQAGINAAHDNDTVLVADSTYYENINFIGKPILVASEFILDGDTNHINNTIINGSQAVNPDKSTVITFETGEDTTSVVCGFTITQGNGNIISGTNFRAGGGVFVEGSGCKLENNYIEYNQMVDDNYTLGGGICAGGPVEPLPWIVLRNNRINHNTAISNNDQGSGGGMEIYYPLIMEGNEIAYNEAKGSSFAVGGGARLLSNFGPVELNVRSNLFTNNKAESTGLNTILVISGGITINGDVSGYFSNNIVSQNINITEGEVLSYGPGLCVDEAFAGNLYIENNFLINNSFAGGTCIGGGLSIYNSKGFFYNNVIMGNTATSGGGIAIEENLSFKVILINNTVSGNDASSGPGLWASSAKAVVVNTIIYNNTPTGSNTIFEENSDLEVHYSDIEGDEVWPGEGNINEEPQFQSDGYHLDDPGLLLNAGVSSITISGVTFECPPYDIDGDLRPYSYTQPEMGVDEVQITEVNEPTLANNHLIELYPNPADQMVTISIRNGATVNEVSIYNQTGQNVYRGMPDDNAIDVSELQPGVYLIEVSCDQQKYREKLIIK